MKEEVALRKFPYPFNAAVAICSDIDNTKTLNRFLAIQEFLNTTNDTPTGPGIGLEIGNTFFPHSPDDSFAYFSSRTEDREVIECLIKSGFIDCIHSYGDGAYSRADALKTLDELERTGCKIDVWVDHARAPSNFGTDVTPGRGDIVQSSIYHADVTLAYGIKFVWKGRVSSVVGHGVPFSVGSFSRIFDQAHPGHSLFNIAREFAKTLLAYFGTRRFSLLRSNELLQIATLKDGQQVFEFKRCNNHWRGLSYGHDSAGLAYVLRRKALDDLISSGGYMIVYTHIGVGPQHRPYLPPITQTALRGLADAYQSGDIYVTTTSRLLNYYLNRRYLQWSHEIDDEGCTRIAIRSVADPLFGSRLPTAEQLQGITFYVPDRHKVQVYLGDNQKIQIERNSADQTGRESVMIPRTFLTYPMISNY